MSFLLHIETTSTVCSVAISQNEKLISLIEVDNGFTHAENLHLFINDCLTQAQITAQQLNAISVSSGPGSYTGLRIGFSSAKGLAYALNIPLIKIDTLTALSHFVNTQIQKDAYYCPLIDARRMEVYFSIHNNQLSEIHKPSNLIISPESISIFKLDKPIYFFGDGMLKSKLILAELPTTFFIENIKPSATHLITLAYAKFINSDFENLAYSEPFYLKDFYFTTASK